MTSSFRPGRARDGWPRSDAPGVPHFPKTQKGPTSRGRGKARGKASTPSARRGDRIRTCDPRSQGATRISDSSTGLQPLVTAQDTEADLDASTRVGRSEKLGRVPLVPPSWRPRLQASRRAPERLMSVGVSETHRLRTGTGRCAVCDRQVRIPEFGDRWGCRTSARKFGQLVLSTAIASNAYDDLQKDGCQCCL